MSVERWQIKGKALNGWPVQWEGFLLAGRPEWWPLSSLMKYFHPDGAVPLHRTRGLTDWCDEDDVDHMLGPSQTSGLRRPRATHSDSEQGVCQKSSRWIIKGVTGCCVISAWCGRLFSCTDKERRGRSGNWAESLYLALCGQWWLLLF